jgi:general secretion pathway protein M
MSAMSTLSARWQGMAARERTLVTAAVALVVLALLWWLAVAPALAVLRSAEPQHRALDEQLGRMRGLQQQVRTLQSQPKLGPDEALRAIEESVRQRLGTSARISVAGERVTITLTGTPPDALAGWLGHARVNARVLPTDVRLTRGASGGWDGTLVLALPAR